MTYNKQKFTDQYRKIFTPRKTGRKLEAWYSHLLGMMLVLLLLGSSVQAQTLVGYWTFEPGAELVDQTGNFNNLVLQGDATVSAGALDVGPSGWAQAIGYNGPTIFEKTLVSWLRLDDLTTTAGSVLTIDKTDVDEFDGIVFSEQETDRWEAGSSGFARTQNPVPGFAETTTGILIKMAITYQNVNGTARIKIYHDGDLIGNYDKGSLPSWAGANTELLFGVRHTVNGTTRGAVNAHIEEARIYDGVLTQAEIQALTKGDATLPVSLTSFSAAAGNGQVTLNWVTESEVDNMGYDILRADSKDGDYQEISSYQYDPRLKGQINTSSRTAYQYIDKYIQPGESYWYKLVDVDVKGKRTEHGPVNAVLSAGDGVIAKGNLPSEYFLGKNYPNPFNPSTNIKFGVPQLQNGEPASIRLVIYNALGQMVRELVNQDLAAGTYRVQWDGRNAQGSLMPSGVYIYQLITPAYQKSEKMYLVK